MQQPLTITVTVAADPQNPTHRAWLERFTALLESTREPDMPKVLPPPVQVTFTDLLEYLRNSDYLSADYMTEARKFWRLVVCAYRRRNNLPLSDDYESVAIPRSEILRLTPLDFKGLRTTGELRERVLKVVQGMCNQA